MDTSAALTGGDDDRWLTAQQAAKLLGVGETKFKELRKAGGFVEHKLGYRTVRYSLRSLQAYMQRRPKPARSRGRS